MTDPRIIYVQDRYGQTWSFEESEAQAWGRRPPSKDQKSVLYFHRRTEYWVLLTDKTALGTPINTDAAAKWLLANGHALPEMLSLQRPRLLAEAPKGILTEPPWLRNPQNTSDDEGAHIPRSTAPAHDTGTAPGREDAPQFVTLSQIAAIVHRSKRTLEKYKTRPRNPLPAPDVQGGGGRSALWSWARIRSWLAAEFPLQIPDQFPASQFRG